MKGDEGRVIPFISAHIPISCFGGFSTNLLQTDRRPCESRDPGQATGGSTLDSRFRGNDG